MSVSLRNSCPGEASEAEGGPLVGPLDVLDVGKGKSPRCDIGSPPRLMRTATRREIAPRYMGGLQMSGCTPLADRQSGAPQIAEIVPSLVWLTECFSASVMMKPVRWTWLPPRHPVNSQTLRSVSRFR